jgi:hypothetical protein
MSSKIIIIALVILLLASISVLFVIEAKNHNYDYNKAWSVIYFENPRDNSLDFAIENHESVDVEYGYKVLANDDKLIEGSMNIKAGVTQKISPVLDSEKIANARVMIVVSYKDMEYKIYKSIGK